MENLNSKNAELEASIELTDRAYYLVKNGDYVFPESLDIRTCIQASALLSYARREHNNTLSELIVEAVATQSDEKADLADAEALAVSNASL